MPVIPMPQTRPLGDVNAPVLDRERRPTVDNSGVGQAVVDVAKASRMPEVPMSLAAPLEALGDFGKEVARAGGMAAAVGIQFKRDQDEIAIRDSDTLMKQRFGEFSNSLHDDAANAANWQKRWTEDASVKLKEELEAKEMSPAARAEVQRRFARFNALSATSVQESAIITTSRRAAEYDDADIELAKKTQNKPLMEAALGRSLRGGRMVKPVADLHWKQFEEAGTKLQLQAKAANYKNAQDIVATLAAGNGIDETLDAIDKKTFPAFKSADPSEIEQLKSYGREVARENGAIAAQTLANAMAKGDIANEAAIRNFAAGNKHITPVITEDAVNRLKTQDREAEAEDRRVNGAQNAADLFQEIQAMQPSGDPKQDSFEYFKKAQAISKRTTEDQSGVLMKTLQAKFWSKPPELKPQEAVMKYALESVSLLYDPENGRIPYEKKVKEMVTGPDGIDRVETKTVTDFAARDRARAEKARVLTKLDEWAKAKPEDFQDPDKVRLKFTELLPEGAAGGAYNDLLKFLPSKSGAALPTGSGTARPISGKVTSYGYEGDDTPDGNSRAGIGAFVPDVEQTKIKRGEKSDYRLREGDLAVSPDVAEQFKKAGIEPMGEVMVQLQNGEVRRMRWADVTANEAQRAQINKAREKEGKAPLKPITGRFDFYSPSGKHRRDGMAVVRFWNPNGLTNSMPPLSSL